MPDVTDQLESLSALDIYGLRELWRLRYGDPPKLRSADLVRRMLAWKIQAGLLGDLDAQTRKALRRSSPTRSGPSPGTRLCREYKGVRHEVEVTETGYRYAGETYASLSAIARKIAGVRWNGWRFFGLPTGARA